MIKECWNCGGEGFSSHDCGEDTCCCADPEPNVRCHVCNGEGVIEVPDEIAVAGDPLAIYEQAQVIDLNILKGAIFSDDHKYRYALWRVWNLHKPMLMLIGLNPSTAGELNDDPTITRSMVRANKTGYGGLLMGNLYAYVSTDPKILLGMGDFVGELTDYYLKRMIAMSRRQLCGWGSFPPVVKRAPIVLGMIAEPYCLGVNADGQPKHPLYIGYGVQMKKYHMGD